MKNNVYKFNPQSGFTLIELSIVLVIIGLIVGGVLVGQDLIRAAEIRAQISQIEKYNTAVNTFRGKFGAIPGDMNASTATQFGFNDPNCTGGIGQRDGNGLIDGGSSAGALGQGGYETGLFWADMSTTGLTQYVDGTYNFSNHTNPTTPCGSSLTSAISTTINLYLPVAKIGHGNYVYVYNNNSINYYGLSDVTNIASGGQITSTPSLTVQQAFNIDQKMDDGLPATGNVITNYVTGNAVTQITTGSCVTNSTYNIGPTTANSAACALSFAFQ